MEMEKKRKKKGGYKPNKLKKEKKEKQFQALIEHSYTQLHTLKYYLYYYY